MSDHLSQSEASGVGMVDRSEFVGIHCDMTTETTVKQAVQQVRETFGGLDMSVLNGGVFPAGCRIDSLDLAEWQRVI